MSSLASRALAATGNNLASALEEKPGRSVDERAPALAFEDEDLDLQGACEPERDGLADGGWHAVTGRPGVRLDEERLSAELGVAGKALVAAEQQEILPGERELAVVREREARILVHLVARAHRLIERRERRVWTFDREPPG